MNSMNISNLWRASSRVLRYAQPSNKSVTQRLPRFCFVSQAHCSTTAHSLRAARNSNDSVFLQNVNRPRRFYKTVDVISVNDKAGDKLLYEIKLNERSLKTQAGVILQLPSRLLASAIAQEWDMQKEYINMSYMRLTGLAFTSIDNPTRETRDTLSAKIFEFLDSDTLLYFAGETGSLLESQCRHWLPIIEWAKEQKDLDLRPSENLMDPPHISDHCRIELKKWLDSYNFGALNAICYGADAVKSFLLMLATMEHKVTINEAAELARLEQIYQSRIWGEVEFMHGVEHQQLCSRLSAAVLFAHIS